MNFPLKIGRDIMLTSQGWEGNYAYYSRVGEKLCLLIDIRTLPLLRSGHKKVCLLLKGGREIMST